MHFSYLHGIANRFVLLRKQYTRHTECVVLPVMTICSGISPSFPVGSCQKVGGVGYGNVGFFSV